MDTNERQSPSEKEPYEPPMIVAEEVFETLALNCGKADPGNFFCQTTNGGVSS